MNYKLQALIGISLMSLAGVVLAVPATPTLYNPSANATNVPLTSTFTWSSVAGTGIQYQLVVSQNSGFTGYKSGSCSTAGTDGTCSSFTLSGTSQQKTMALSGKTYYWAVRAFSTSAGSSNWVGRSFTTAGTAISPISAKVDAFVTKWLGKGTSYGGYAGNYQCVALMRQYLLDVFSLPNTVLPSTGSAYSIYANANDSRFTRIANTPTGVPQKGDIMFWNKLSSNGYYGHVAIVLSATTSSFTSIDQNWYNSSATKGSVAAKVTHTYSGVVGWLHPK